MDLRLTDEQRMLQESIARFLTTGTVDMAVQTPDRWRGLADLGLLGAALPAELGGFGGGPIETMIIMEELGRAGAAEPFLESVVLGGGLLTAAEGASAAAWIGKLIAGQAKLCIAHDEAGNRFSDELRQTRARPEGDGWRIDGSKIVAVGGPDADMLIVSATAIATPGGAAACALFLVDPALPGVARRDLMLVDGRPAADFTFSDVRIGSEALLLKGEAASRALRDVLDSGIAALCAEGVGVMRRMLADTLDYARQRRQFGQPLASFQVLQHRMVDMHIAVECAAAATLLAMLKLDAEGAARRKAVAAAKATICESVRFVSQNAVQIHGAMGLTEELAIGHFFRRAMVIEQRFGAQDHHLADYGALSRLE